MPTLLVILIVVALLCVVLVQLSRIIEISQSIRGEEDARYQNSELTGKLLLIFVAVFLVAVFVSAYQYKNYILGYGPHESASVHGHGIDQLMHWTLIITGIVFVATQIALFYFSYKYREQKGQLAEYISHDNKLEMIWTITPALVLVLLVFKGIDVWGKTMTDVKEGEDYIELEATGMQFAWLLRYPGNDKVFGARDFRKITGINPLGQDWTDTKNLDDFQPAEIVIPKGKKIRVSIRARDVLHNFYLPHFRLKMDAVPGMPTHFVFEADKTTEEYRQMLKEYPEYNVPIDPEDPESKMKWEAFEYELACAELCGNGHFSMRKIVKVVEPDEYEKWYQEQCENPYYFSSVRNTDEDPFKGQILDWELNKNSRELKASFEEALSSTDEANKTLRLDNINFRTGSADLTESSTNEISTVADLLKSHPETKVELAGHTDNVGNAASNLTLSQQRADAVKNTLLSMGVQSDQVIAKGYGDTAPIADNATPEGRAENRRTEIKILE